MAGDTLISREASVFEICWQPGFLRVAIATLPCVVAIFPHVASPAILHPDVEEIIVIPITRVTVASFAGAEEMFCGRLVTGSAICVAFVYKFINIPIFHILMAGITGAFRVMSFRLIGFVAG